MIGEKLKKLRLSNSLTQEELADRSELTKGYISQLENDLTSPAITTLKDILDVLGVGLSEFFADEKASQTVFRREDRTVYSDTDEGFHVDLLVPGAQRRAMDPALVTIAPGEALPSQEIHEGEEFGYLIQGKVELELNGKRQRVSKGECFYFRSDRQHRLLNTGKHPAQLIWVVTPPTFDY